jgi:hypothetical protein
MRASSPKLLAQASSLLVVAAVGIYGVGVYQMYSRLCARLGPSIAISAVGVLILAAGVLLARALLVRSAVAWVTFVTVLFLVAVMYLFVGVLAAGCSGI